MKLTKEKVLVISGEHTANNEVTESGNCHSERISRTFTRRYQLPDNTETESILAKLQDGMLTLTVPKAEAPEPEDQEILIQEAASNVGATSSAATSVDDTTDAEASEAKLQHEMSTASVKEDTPGASSEDAARYDQHSAKKPDIAASL